MSQPVKAIFACTGVGTGNRGIESFFRECFDGLHGTPGLSIKLLKGRGADDVDEQRVWCLPKDGPGAALVGKFVNRSPYIVEQMTSLIPIVMQVRSEKPDVVFTSDGNMATRLVRFRKWIGVDFRLVFSNGAPMPPPFPHSDHVQHVTPFEYDIALNAGESPERHSMVPYGIRVPEGDPLSDPAARLEIRRRLGLPTDRPIVLSVGWISAELKRMNHLVDEIAKLPTPRPYLVMLGSIDESSQPIIQQAKEKLGDENFTARSVPYGKVVEFYQSADLFTLCSLREGFGRVFMEAQIHGLACIVNDHPVMRYVLGEHGTFVDMNQPGTLAPAIQQQLQQLPTADIMAQRRQSVRDRFSWQALAPAYLEMFRSALRNPPVANPV